VVSLAIRFPCGTQEVSASLRRKANLFFAMLKTMQSVDPDMYFLENVEGLQRRRVQWEGEERSCLDVVQLLLRQHLPRHRHALAPPRVTTPIKHRQTP